MWPFFLENWGSLASVLGLLVSLGTFLVAQRAKNAAREARDAARRRNLAEEIQETMTKAVQIGLFLPQSRWDIVWLRAQELVAASSTVRARWEDHLDEASKNSLLLIRSLSQSIVSAALQASTQPPSPGQVNRIAATHGRVLELLGGELGKIQSALERGVA